MHCIYTARVWKFDAQFDVAIFRLHITTKKLPSQHLDVTYSWTWVLLKCGFENGTESGAELKILCNIIYRIKCIIICVIFTKCINKKITNMSYYKNVWFPKKLTEYMHGPLVPIFNRKIKWESVFKYLEELPYDTSMSCIYSCWPINKIKLVFK